MSTEANKSDNSKFALEIILLAIALLLMAITTFNWLGDNLSLIAGQLGIGLLIVMIVMAAVRGAVRK